MWLELAHICTFAHVYVCTICTYMCVFTHIRVSVYVYLRAYMLTNREHICGLVCHVYVRSISTYMHFYARIRGTITTYVNINYHIYVRNCMHVYVRFRWYMLNLYMQVLVDICCSYMWEYSTYMREFDIIFICCFSHVYVGNVAHICSFCSIYVTSISLYGSVITTL